MAKKVAGSGLDFECLRLAHSRSADGIHALFTEQCDNSSIRVTKCKKIIDSVANFFMSLNESWIRYSVQSWYQFVIAKHN